MKLTIKVKLLPTEQQKQSLLKTMEVFNAACNYISQVAHQNKRFSQVPLHHDCYYAVREKFQLSAQFVVRAIDKVSQSYKIEKKSIHKFKKHSAIVYDPKLLSFKKLDTCNILTIDGRQKMPIIIGQYARLEGKKIRGQADLIYQKGKFYLCLVVEYPENAPIDPEGILGVDMGIVNLATTSDGKTFSGKNVDKIREKTTKFKKCLQRKGSKNAKRHLKNLSGKELRFKRNINHVISKRIVSIAKGTNRAIGLEDLNGFKVTVRKADKERFGKWAFLQLRQYIEYKAQMAGIPVISINPRNTSQECSECHHISKSNRKSQALFSCESCGFTINADLNGAINIASRATVNLPIAVHADILNPPPLGTASQRL